MFEKHLEAFSRKRVLLIGDTIVDMYTYGRALGLSAETPTIVARKTEIKTMLGGAAFVCRNLLELGAKVDFVTLVGGDDEATTVTSFQHPNLTLHPIFDPKRTTTIKHRFWVDDYKLFQLDNRDDTPVGEEFVSRIAGVVSRLVGEADTVVVSDYRHGMLPAAAIDRVKAITSEAGKVVLVDSQVSQNKSNHRDYVGATLICVNIKEARTVDPHFSYRPEAAAFAELAAILNPRFLVIKLGENGAAFFDGTNVVHAPAKSVPVIDTAGAGDAFLAALSLCDLSSPDTALEIANAWAGLSVGQRGTMIPNLANLPGILDGS